MMKTIIDTKTVADFLSEEEIQRVEAIAAANTHWSHPDTAYGKSAVPLANYHYFDLYKDGPHKPLADMLLPRLKSLLHPEIFIDDCHIMDSVQPYTPHSDVLTPVPGPGYRYAWTVIIPLGNYFSNTFVFEEECSWTKDVLEWARTTNAVAKDVISDDFYRRYFTHSRREDFRYLTIHEMFPWRKGWLSATSRSRFHCSDNYLSRGLKMKRGIVMWTSLPEHC